MASYLAGNRLQLQLTVTDNGSPAQPLDPGALSLKYQVAGGAVVTKNYPADITRISAGVYVYVIDLTGLAGTLEYEWIGTGVNAATVAGAATISALPV